MRSSKVQLRSSTDTFLWSWRGDRAPQRHAVDASVHSFMNNCLMGIGIHHPKFRERAIAEMVRRQG